jgi:hypothetical protein
LEFNDNKRRSLVNSKGKRKAEGEVLRYDLEYDRRKTRFELRESPVLFS